jgi:hypothetical protein
MSVLNEGPLHRDLTPSLEVYLGTSETLVNTESVPAENSPILTVSLTLAFDTYGSTIWLPPDDHNKSMIRGILVTS